jgi:hypothetical protein
VLRLYVERVPEVGYENSCIFHGKQGCTLDRSLRSDVCNSYFCGGLQGYLTGDELVTPTMIIAGVGDQMRTSPILSRKIPRRAALNLNDVAPPKLDAEKVAVMSGAEQHGLPLEPRSSTRGRRFLKGDFPAFPVSRASLAQTDVCEKTLISLGFRITV